MKKIKCFTHGDLDGVVSNLLFCRFYNSIGFGHSTETGATGEDIDKKILAYINNSREYSKDDVIIVTDVCMSYNVAAILNNLPNTKIHIDHHDTSRKMLSLINPDDVDFSWSYIREGDSATMLAYKYLEKMAESEPVLLSIIKEYRTLVVITDLWDTKSRDCEDYINWRDKIENTNALMSALGWAGTKARFMLNPSIELDEIEHTKIETIKKIKDNVMRYTNVYVRPIVFKEQKHVYGVCFVGLYRSEVAEYIASNNSELLFVAMINMNDLKVSLRRAKHSLSEEIDLIQIATQFDKFGGGHPFACGFGFTLENYTNIIDSMMNAKFTLE